jgi:hypothetical protein
MATVLVLRDDIKSKNPAVNAGFKPFFQVRRTGIEPVTLGLKGPCSAN